MYDKVFLNIDEQLELLKSRGLVVKDEERAKSFLERNNYYRISGYSLTLRSHDVFHSDATFQNIIDIYTFDHEFRHLLLKYIEIIEITVKSIYAYEFSNMYGPFEYSNPSNFTNDTEHSKIINKVEEQKNKRHKDEAYIKHFLDDLNSNIPFWAYIDLFTISDISRLYSISSDNLKLAVSTRIGLTYNKAPYYLGKFMHSITIIRNLCAHGNRIYNRLFEQKPFLSEKDKKLLLTTQNGEIDNAHLFGFLLLIRKLLKPNQFKDFKVELIKLSDKFSFVDMKYYGFPDNWKKVL